MKRKIWLGVGTVSFVMLWPAIWLYLRRGTRTRLLLICEDEFLILRGWLGSARWMLPGGGVHEGETPMQGLLREVKEETGISLSSKDVKLLYEKATSHQAGLRFVYDCFVCQVKTKPTIHPQKGEIVDYTWQSLAHPTKSLNHDVRAALAHWHKLQQTNH